MSKIVDTNEYRLVRNLPRVNSMGTFIILDKGTDSEGNAVPVFPSNSIFGDGEYIRVTAAEHTLIMRSVKPEDLTLELVPVLSTAGGSLTKKEYFVAKNAPHFLLKLIHSASWKDRDAARDVLIEALKDDVVRFIDHNLLNAPIPGVASWCPWVIGFTLGSHEVGLGANMARTHWRRVVKYARSIGIEVSEQLENAVYKNPTLLNGSGMIVNRQPYNNNFSHLPADVVVTDYPGVSPQIAPKLMKLMGGDNDGDASSNFTGSRLCSIASIISQVEVNFAAKRRDPFKRVFGMGFEFGSPVGQKKGEMVDITLQNVKWEKGNLWNDYLGFLTKGLLGSATVTLWKYIWAFNHRLTDEEVITFASELAKEIGEDVPSIHTDLKTYKRTKSWVQRGILCQRLAIHAFENFFEHINDARKGVKLAYSPLDTLTGLSRTGQIDWEGMAAEGIPTKVFKLVADRLWVEATSQRGNVYHKYGLNEMIQQNDPVFHTLVTKRNESWKAGNAAVDALWTTLVTEGLEGLAKSLEFRSGYIDIPILEVGEDKKQPPVRGEVVDMLEDAVVRNGFNLGPNTKAEMNAFLQERGINFSLSTDEEGYITITLNEMTRRVGQYSFKKNGLGFPASILDTPGHVIYTPTVRRACPQVLIHEKLNPFCMNVSQLKCGKYGQSFPLDALEPEGFTLLNLVGQIAYIVYGVCQKHNDPLVQSRACARALLALFQKCELITNELAERVFGDMVKVEISKANMNSEWSSMAGNYFAKYLFEQGFSLTAVGKNNPDSKFVKIDPELGVPRFVAAYNTFWPIRVARRYDREALSVLRKARKLVTSNTLQGVTDQLGFEDLVNDYRSHFRLAFFNTEALDGEVDGVFFTPEGMSHAASSDIQWVWMSYSDSKAYLESLKESVREYTLEVCRWHEEEGNKLTRKVPLDEGIETTYYKVPTHFGDVNPQTMAFKLNLPGTKSFVQNSGVQLVCSHKPIRSIKSFRERLGASGASGVHFIHGVMPGDTIVAKGAYHLVVEAAASQLDIPYVLKTTQPDEIISPERVKAFNTKAVTKVTGDVVDDIATRLKAEGKSPDGRMYIYRLDGDTITPLMNGDKPLKAVVGLIPGYRIPFEAGEGNTMSKLRTNGLPRITFIERALMGETFDFSPETNLELATMLHNLKLLRKDEPVKALSEDFGI